MSTISNINTISQFTKDSKAAHGCTLVMSRGNAKSGTVSICSSMLPISAEQVQENLSDLMPHIQDMLSDVRSKIMRDLYQAGREEIREDQAGVAACIDWLNAQARLTKESIQEFFAQEENRELMRAVFCEKLGWNGELTSAQHERLDNLAAGLSTKMAELSSGKTLWSEKEQNTALKYLELLEDGMVKDKLISRIADMSRKAKGEDLMEVLGF